MKRRNFVMSVLAGGAAVPVLAAEYDHDALSGPLASATVSFGEWSAAFTPPLDRFMSSPGAANLHEVLPFETQIRAGWSGELRHLRLPRVGNL